MVLKGRILVSARNRPKLSETSPAYLKVDFQLYVGKDSVRIGKCPKSTDFEQKPWAIAHGFE